MKMTQLLTVLASVFVLSMGTVQADTCCQKAKKEGKACAHKCCVEAAKSKVSCEKCNPKKDKK